MVALPEGEEEAVGEGADRDTRGRACSPEMDSVGETPTGATGTVALPRKLLRIGDIAIGRKPMLAKFARWM